MQLSFQPALTKTDLLAKPVQALLTSWTGATPVSDIHVAEIDPAYMGGKELCDHYGVNPKNGANCVIVEGVRGDVRTIAACLIPVTCTKADFNGAVRKHLNARRVSLLSLDIVLEKTGMEYGSITVVGLPAEWKILIDPTVTKCDQVIIGSGLQKSKLSLPGKTLLELPNAELLDGLCLG